MNTRQHPALVSASSCNAGSCSAVDTRAYPTRCPAGFGFRAAGRFRAGPVAAPAAARADGFAGLAAGGVTARCGRWAPLTVAIH